MNKKILVFGIVFILLMVGFVNAYNVSFTATELGTQNTLNATFYAGLTNESFDIDNYYVLIEADSLIETSIESDGPVVTQLNSTLWKINYTDDWDVSRAIIMQSLFYGAVPFNIPRITTEIVNLTSISSNDPRDTGKTAYYAEITGINAEPDGSHWTVYANFTFSETSDNYNVSSWSRLYDTNDDGPCSGGATAYWQLPTGTNLNFWFDTTGSSSQQSDLGVDTSADDYNNPSNGLLRSQSCEDASDDTIIIYSQVLVLSKGNVSIDFTGDTAQLTANDSIDFYQDYNIPAFSLTYDETTTDLNLETGNYTIFAKVDNYYNQTKEIEITGDTTVLFNDFYNSLLNITATDNSTGSPINTFNASIDLQNGSSVSYGTTSGSIEIPVLDGETYNITVSSDAAQYVTSTEEVVVSGFTDSYDFNVYTFNSVRINVYDGLDNGLMSQNVTIQTISDLSSFENITSTGTILIDFLAPNDYELRFISDGYNTVSKFITVSNDSTQIVNSYMILNNDSESQQVHVTNLGTPINTDMEGAVVRLQQENIGGDSLYVTIQESITNSEGDTNVWVVRDASTFYRFQVIYNGTTLLTTTKTAFLPSVTETIELIVDTSEAGDSILEDDASLSYTTVWSGVNNETFTFDWSDASSTIVGGRLLVTGQYLNVSLEEQTISDVSFVGASGTLAYTLPVLNNTKYTVYAYITYSEGEKLVYSAPRVFESDILVDPNSGILIAGLVFIITIFATYLLGPLWSGIIGFSSLMLLTLLNIVILPVTIITSFIAFFALMFIKIRRGQQ